MPHQYATRANAHAVMLFVSKDTASRPTLCCVDCSHDCFTSVPFAADPTVGLPGSGECGANNKQCVLAAGSVAFDAGGVL